MILGGCAALPTIQSVPYEGQFATMFSGADKTSGIRYQVAKDKDYFYITLNTSESATSQSIVRNGLKLYFDEKGKKRKKVYLEYPVAQQMKMGGGQGPGNGGGFSPGGQNGKSGGQNQKGGNSDRDKEGPQEMPISSEMVWSKNSVQETLDNSTENIGIKAELIRSKGELTYQLKIPIREILIKKEQNELEKIAIGVISEAASSSSSGGPGGGMSGGPGGGSGGPGGGMGGPGGGMGGPGGGSGGPGGGSGGMSGGGSGGPGGQSSASINFWFAVKL